MNHAKQIPATSWNGLETLEERIVLSAPTAVPVPLVAPAVVPATTSVPQTPTAAPAATSANTLYIQKLYQDMLNRQGAPSEVAAWATLLDQGGIKDNVVNAFRNSIEYINLEVDAAYQSFFHRPADSVGLTFWSHYISKDLPIGQFYIRLLNSNEYLTAHPDVTSYVTGLYHDILGRGASPTEIAGWTTSGNDYITLASDFVYSNERTQNAIAGYYAALFNRQPDYTSYVNYVQYVQTQDREVTNLLTTFLVSQEYINLPVSTTNIHLAGVGIYQDGVPFPIGQPIAV